MTCLANRADLARETHDLPAARADYELALRLAPTVSYRWGEAINCLELGDVVRQQGEYGRALELTERALTLMQEVGDRVEEARATAYLGRLYGFLGDYARAQSWLARFLESAAVVESHEMVGDGLLPLAVLTLQLGEAEQARAYAEHAWQLAREVASPYALARAQVVLAQTHAARGLDTAAPLFAQALARYEALASVELAAEARAGLANIAFAQGDLGAALAHVDALLPVLTAHPYVGLDEPFGVYVTCYSVLDACDDGRAAAVLDTAGGVLNAYAERIGDGTLRQSFLQQVPAHRTLVQAVASHRDEPPQQGERGSRSSESLLPTWQLYTIAGGGPAQ